MAAVAASGAGAGAPAEPDTIETGAAVFELAMHPKLDAVAVGLIDGTIQLYSYSAVQNKLLQEFDHHDSSIRCLEFAGDGSCMFTGSSDRSISMIDSAGNVAWHQESAHNSPLNAMALFATHVLATGDDNGVIKVWDARSHKCAFRFKHHSDFISDFEPVLDKNTLVVTSGDGTLSAIDLRTGGLAGRSDQLEEELLCAAAIKGGKKLVAGTTEGTLAIYSWGQWADMSDRFPGHPGSINCMLALGPHTVLTGAEDGNIRAVQLQPNAMLNIVGQHSDGGVERMRLSRDGALVASTSHGENVQFWDVAALTARAVSDAPLAPGKQMGSKTAAGAAGPADAVWDDDAESLSDDSDVEGAPGGSAVAGGRMGKMAKAGSAGFFAEL